MELFSRCKAVTEGCEPSEQEAEGIHKLLLALRLPDFVTTESAINFYATLKDLHPELCIVQNLNKTHVWRMTARLAIEGSRLTIPSSITFEDAKALTRGLVGEECFPEELFSSGFSKGDWQAVSISLALHYRHLVPPLLASLLFENKRKGSWSKSFLGRQLLDKLSEGGCEEAWPRHLGFAEEWIGLREQIGDAPAWTSRKGMSSELKSRLAAEKRKVAELRRDQGTPAKRHAPGSDRVACQ